MPGVVGENTKATWERLLAVYRTQSVISHKKAASQCGTDRTRAGRLYHNGAPRLDLPPIKQVLEEKKAQTRADRYQMQKLSEQAALTDAQDDARQVALLEAQMIAALRRGAAIAVKRIWLMLEALDPLAEQIAEDITKMVADEKTTASERRALMREVMSYQREAGEMVEQVMNLERRFLNEPTAVLGAELTQDVGDLARRARESAKVLQQTAALMIDVTPEATKH